uniref:UPAR/Ly6 domain-containing protein n=1 Tax=Panagrellus redivivus TaxID=6233 RepID=A0A7E4VA16_PANRE
MGRCSSVGAITVIIQIGRIYICHNSTTQIPVWHYGILWQLGPTRVGTMRSTTALLVIAFLCFIANSDGIRCFVSTLGDRMAPEAEGCSACAFVRRKSKGIVYAEFQRCLHPEQLIPMAQECQLKEDGSAEFMCASDLCNSCPVDTSGANLNLPLVGLAVAGFAFFAL